MELIKTEEIQENELTYIVNTYNNGTVEKYIKPDQDYVPPDPPEPSTEPTNQDIMDMLVAMQGDQVPKDTLDAAYREGVNSYE